MIEVKIMFELHSCFLGLKGFSLSSSDSESGSGSDKESETPLRRKSFDESLCNKLFKN